MKFKGWRRMFSVGMAATLAISSLLSTSISVSAAEISNDTKVSMNASDQEDATDSEAKKEEPSNEETKDEEKQEERVDEEEKEKGDKEEAKEEDNEEESDKEKEEKEDKEEKEVDEELEEENAQENEEESEIMLMADVEDDLDSIGYASIIVDGNEEDSWDKAKVFTLESVLDGADAGTDGNAKIKVCWDEAYLYIAADVLDSDVYAVGGKGEEEDSITLTIANNNQENTAVNNLIFTAKGEALSAKYSGGFSGTSKSYSELDKVYSVANIQSDGWKLEACIEWAALGFAPASGESIALEAVVNSCSSDSKKLDYRKAIKLTEYPQHIFEGIYHAEFWGMSFDIPYSYNEGLYAQNLIACNFGDKTVDTIAENIGRYDLIKYVKSFKETYVDGNPILDSFDEDKLKDAKEYALSQEATADGIAEKRAGLEAMAKSIQEDNCYGKMLTKYGTPVIDGYDKDELWNSAYTYQTKKDDKGQYAEIKTLWDEEALYALVKVYDPTYDVSGSDAHTKDSVEFFFLEPADAANNSFGRNGGQWRINRANMITVTFGTNEAFYGKLTEMPDGKGYIVEARLNFADGIKVEKDLVMNFDIAVNLCENGGRTSAVAWTSGDCYSNPKTSGQMVCLEAKADGSSEVQNGYNPYALIKVLDKALKMDVKDYDAASFNANYDKEKLQKYYDEAMEGKLSTDQINSYYSEVINMMSKITYDGVHRSALGFEANHKLPNPFTFENGKSVASEKDWNLRHDEIQDLYEFYMYGKLPKAEETGLTKEFSVNEDGSIHVATTRKLGENTLEGSFDFKVYLPEGEPKDEKGFPYIINYGGNIDGAQDAGYAVIDYSSYSDVAANNSYYQGLFYEMYPECRGDIYATGVGPLAARAWGAGLIIDAVENKIGDLAKLNPANSAVTGFSFLGKTALVTGVLEERIAVTNPAHSGIGGAALFRFSSQGKVFTEAEYGFDQLVDKTEPIGQVQGQGMTWVKTIFADFIGADSTPFDTHMLMSLVAPRGLYISAGYKDNGTDPEGMYASYINAKEVYKFLDAEGNIAYGNFPTAHQTSTAEWESLFQFCDYYFYEKDLPEGFRNTVFDNSPDIAEYYQIKAPEKTNDSDNKPGSQVVVVPQTEESAPAQTQSSQEETASATPVVVTSPVNETQMIAANVDVEEAFTTMSVKLDATKLLKMKTFELYHSQRVLAMANIANGVGITFFTDEIAGQTKDIDLRVKKVEMPGFAAGFDTYSFEFEKPQVLSFNMGLNMNVGANLSGKLAYVFEYNTETKQYVNIAVMKVNEIGNVGYFSNRLSRTMILVTK